MRTIKRNGECSCCHSHPVKVYRYELEKMSIQYRGRKPDKDGKVYVWYCHLCYTTMAGTKWAFPNDDYQTLEIMKHICAVGNQILRKLGK